MSNVETVRGHCVFKYDVVREALVLEEAELPPGTRVPSPQLSDTELAQVKGMTEKMDAYRVVAQPLKVAAPSSSAQAMDTSPAS